MCQLNNYQMLDLMLNEFNLKNDEINKLINFKSHDKYWYYTPLMIATQNKNVECVKILCQFFDCIDILNYKARYPSDCNALELACIYPNPSILFLLFDSLLKQYQQLVKLANDDHDQSQLCKSKEIERARNARDKGIE